MSTKDLQAATFTGLVNLADEYLGAQALQVPGGEVA